MRSALDVEWLVDDWIGILNGDSPLEAPAVLRALENEGLCQLATVGAWTITMAWRIPGYNLRNYMLRLVQPAKPPRRTLMALNEFCLYEIKHDRRVVIWFEDARAREAVEASIREFFGPASIDFEPFLASALAGQRERVAAVRSEPLHVSGCGFCHESGCISDLVCHVTDARSAISILRSGNILSACRAFGVSGQELTKDTRNAAGDPPDYFDYVMFGPGNCTAVDKLVLERTLGHVPSWEEFAEKFQPGVRFYFRSSDLRAHPGFVFDGIHEKIHGELALADYLVALVIPGGLEPSCELAEMASQAVPQTQTALMPYFGLYYKDWAQRSYRLARLASIG